MKKINNQTYLLENPVYIHETASIVGPKEKDGPMANYFDTLLEEIITHGLFENFDNQYKCYLKYLKHLENLRKKGFSYKALIYLHKNGYDNITGIKNKYEFIK